MATGKGKIGVSSDNLFPIIKRFLYSEHDIFLREIVSNAVDATQKLKTLVARGEANVAMDNAKVSVFFDKEAKTITVSDCGIGMTAEEVEKYINQIAFSGASEFLDKYKDDSNAIIGHFGLGFYSSFMVSHKVEVVTKSYREGAQAVRWVCDGSPEYSLEDATRDHVGTDIIMHVNEESEEFLDKTKLGGILTKYCKFLPIPVVFGKNTEWKDGKEVETEEDNQINDCAPAWTKTPADLKDEDYASFYRQLYPMAFNDDPLFHIHLNVDYPFNLTGILYFPRLKNSVEVQKNKIQLYCNQVFVTDQVEGIVPDFLTLLHGVIDSPDIPLNVSRSYLQGDTNVRKISSHITKKVGDRLQQLFKDSRDDFEQKWDDLKIFIEYGILSEEKFEEKAMKFFLFKNTDGKYFTWEEYENLIKDNQTDKDNKQVYLYASNLDEQYTFIQDAKDKGYDVMVMDDALSTHLMNKFEQKYTDKRFVRIDSDVVDNLIPKEEQLQEVSEELRNQMAPVFQAVCPKGEKVNYLVDFKAMSETAQPMVITRNEFMRRMKDMSALGGGQMSFYGEMPESLNLTVNTNHPLVKKVIDAKQAELGADLEAMGAAMATLQAEKSGLEKAQEGKKEEEIASVDKENLEGVNKKISEMETTKRQKLEAFGKENKLAKQLVDLALLANGLLKGADLDKFVRRSVDLIK
ncbi:MAG: molecular chaperone HtpG [Mangrovibacterium sp.]